MLIKAVRRSRWYGKMVVPHALRYLQSFGVSVVLVKMDGGKKTKVGKPTLVSNENTMSAFLSAKTKMHIQKVDRKNNGHR